MSNSLVRASLELLDFDNNVNKDKKKKKNRTQGALELIPAKHRITKKGKKLLILQRSSKITVHEAKKQLQAIQDPTEDNVRRLLLLSSSKIDPEVADQLFDRAVKGRAATREEKLTQEEPSVFTEEDFKNFEAEYQL